MQLNIKYQNGEHRIVNLTPAFFDNDLNSKSGSAEKRATDIAYQLGNRPYHVVLNQSGRILMDKKYPGNEPPLVAVTKPVNEKELKKQLRKEFKHIPFTLKLIVSEGNWNEIKPQSQKEAA